MAAVLPLAARRLRSPRALLAAVALLAAGSFAAGQAMLARDPLFAFYMLPTRAGGLLLGALAAVAAHAGLVREVDPSEAVADLRLAPGTKSATAGMAVRTMSTPRAIVAGIGAVLVVGSFAGLSDTSPFPGWRAALPSLGAILLLLAGAAGPNPVSRLLSSTWLVAIGLVSYSAYLWHWPLVAFHRYAWGAPHGFSRLAIGVLTAVLAWPSWRWVEQPARRSNASLPGLLLRQWALPSVPIALLAAWSIATGGLGPRALSQEYSAEL
ncbi:MAG: acyltransferase family protein, partial [Alphaproteobacteria bacterium]